MTKMTISPINYDQEKKTMIFTSLCCNEEKMYIK